MQPITDKSSQPVRIALNWSFFETLFNRCFSLLIKLAIVRLVMPEAFGLIGMASVFVSFLHLASEMGMTAALIQRKDSRLSERHWQTAFTFSFVVAIAGWLLIYTVLAPFASYFYAEPRLTLVLRALGLGLIIDSLSIIQKSKLVRVLQFRAVGIASVISIVVSSIFALTMAYLGFGVWALVVRTLINSTLRCAILWSYVGWIPRLQFYADAFRELFAFSAYVFLEQVLMFLLGNIDFLLIGKLIGAAGLGIYSLAFAMTDMVRAQIMGTFNRVFFPVYARLQDEKRQVAQYFLKVVRYCALFINPLMFILICEADAIVSHCFGERWTGTVRPMQILALSVVIHAFGGTASTFIRGAGHARLAMMINFIGVAFVAVPAISAGVLLAGLNGAAFGVLAHRTITRSITLFYVFRLFPINWIDIVRAVRPSAVICVVVTGLSMVLSGLLADSLFALMIRLFVAMLMWLVLMFILDFQLRAATAVVVNKVCAGVKRYCLPTLKPLSR